MAFFFLFLTRAGATNIFLCAAPATLRRPRDDKVFLGLREFFEKDTDRLPRYFFHVRLEIFLD